MEIGCGSKVVCGEDGVLMRLLGLFSLGCGKTLGGNGGIFLDLLDLKWVAGLRSDFGTMCGVRI
jgi:hypothetical protein